MAFMKFSKGKPLLSVPNGIGDGSAYFSQTEGVIANVDNLPYGNSARTISCWVYPTQTNPFNSTMDFFSYGYPSTNNRYGLGIAKDFTSFKVFGYSNTTTYNYSVELKKWYHIVFTFDTDYTEKCYVNGVLIGTQTHSNINTLQGSATIGRTTGDDSTSWFYGNIKNVQIYNRVLSAEEVTTLYSQGAVTDGLVLNIPLQYGKDDESIFTSKSFVYDYATLTTSSGFDEFGYPIGYDIASECGIALYTSKIDFDNSAYFDGNSNYARLNDELPLPYNNDPRSVSLWVYYIGTSGNYSDWQNIIVWGVRTNYSTYGVFLNQNKLAMSGYYNDHISSIEVTKNTWHHIVFTYDGNNNHQMFLDGELKDSYTLEPLATQRSDSRIMIGANYWFNEEMFNGNVTELNVFNRALTQAEVTKLYNQKAIKDGLVLHVPLQEGKDDDSIFTNKNFTYGLI
jgi:hypothetical protein